MGCRRLRREQCLPNDWGPNHVRPPEPGSENSNFGTNQQCRRQPVPSAAARDRRLTSGPLSFSDVPRGTAAGVGQCCDGVLVGTLLDGGAEGDVAEAEAAVERLAAAPTDEGLVIRDTWLPRLLHLREPLQ
jgi:hypothetical protein